MIDVEKLKLGDIVESDGTICNFPKGTKHKVVSATELKPYWISEGSVAIDGFSYVEENFTLVATKTKYSDIQEGDVVEVALVDEGKLQVWPKMAELIGQQGRVVYKGKQIEVNINSQAGVHYCLDAHELRVVSKKMEFKARFDGIKVLNVPPAITKADLDTIGGLMEKVYSSPPKKATDFLSKALSLLEERGKDYDQPEGERSMGKTVTAFNAITGHNLKESDGWLILQLLKDVRQNQNRDSYHADSAEDCISYAALKAEALAEGK